MIGLVSHTVARRAAAWLAVWVPLAAFGCQPPPAWTQETLPPAEVGTLRCRPSATIEPGRCATRCGEYHIDFEQLEGDCGRRPSQRTRLDSEPSVPPYPCRGSLASSANHCSSSFDIRCPVKDESGTSLGSIERGRLDWAPDGSTASGTLELRLFHADGEPKCRSSYQTRVRRL